MAWGWEPKASRARAWGLVVRAWGPERGLRLRAKAWAWAWERVKPLAGPPRCRQGSLFQLRVPTHKQGWGAVGAVLRFRNHAFFVFL